MKKLFLIVGFLLAGLCLFAATPTYDELKTMLSQTTAALVTTTDQLKASSDKISTLEKENLALEAENKKLVTNTEDYDKVIKFFQDLDPSIKDYSGIKLYFSNVILPTLEANTQMIAQLKEVITKVDQIDINLLRDDINKLLVPDILILKKDLEDLIAKYTQMKYFALGLGLNYDFLNKKFGINTLFTLSIPYLPLNVYAGASIPFNDPPNPSLMVGVQVRF
jgi:hypothetical protein